MYYSCSSASKQTRFHVHGIERASQLDKSICSKVRPSSLWVDVAKLFCPSPSHVHSAWQILSNGSLQYTKLLITGKM